MINTASIGIRDDDAFLLELSKEAASLLDAGNTRDARRRVEEIRLTLLSRFQGWKIKTGADTWLGKEGVGDPVPTVYKTAGILKSSLGNRIANARYTRSYATDQTSTFGHNWQAFKVVNHDDEEYDLFPWMMKNCSDNVITEACSNLLRNRPTNIADILPCPICDPGRYQCTRRGFRTGRSEAMRLMDDLTPQLMEAIHMGILPRSAAYVHGEEPASPPDPPDPPEPTTEEIDDASELDEWEPWDGPEPWV